MQISAQLIQDATLAIQSTENEAKFILLTNFFTVNGANMISFENDVSNEPFHQKIPLYLFLLNNEGYAIDFIEYYLASLKPKQHDFPQIKKLSQSLNEQFSKRNNEWKISNGLFENCLIKKNFAFLDRKALRQAIENLINSRENPVLILKGQPKAGLSYIKLYLSEIETNLQIFCMIDLNLKHEIATYATGVVYAAHIAKVMCIKMGLNYDIDLEKPTMFKVIPFLLNLKIHLSKSNQLYLYFIDQFDTAMSDDAYALINGLAEQTLEVSQMLLVLSGYDKSDDWDFFLEQNSTTCNIDDGNISIDHVEEFFIKVYDHLILKVPEVNFTRESFILELSPIINNADFYQHPANATIVGRQLSKWYKGFYENIKLNATAKD